ncbi:GGDEF domain-containing protein [Comamonas sp. GB3 AK4-5]|uniref:GGDEF domain-containing protein n=1 Tax=Comamonas sp. GB3 AK4-5 TaxID=3231487 RepID=UPI00351E9933
MNLPADQYFALIAPICVILLGAVLLACWWTQRRQVSARFLLWLAAGYVLPAVAVGAQSLMSNAQLAQWTLLTAGLYLMGSWCMAQGMAQRYGQAHASRWLGAIVTAVTLALLRYFSQVYDDLWARVQWLNLGMGILQFLAMPSLLRAAPARDRLEKALRWTYIAFSCYILMRPLMVWLVVPTAETGQMARSGFWLLTLAGTLLFSLWFSLVLLSCAVRDVFTTLREERNRDPLTRLLNRRAFMEAAEAVLTDRRTGPWAVVAADIDHFKKVNDNWGHGCGDQVLQSVSQVLLKQVRAGDAVARFGGEEFVVLLQRVSLEAAEHVVQRIAQELRRTEMACLPRAQAVSMSFGIAPVAGLPGLAAALSHADELLYAAKQAGRDRICVAPQPRPPVPPPAASYQDILV